MTPRVVATTVAASGLVAAALAQPYTVPGIDGFDPHRTFRSVGIFGPFGVGDKLQERTNAGLPTFCLNRDLPSQSYYWINFVGKDNLALGKACFPGTLASQRFDIVDWTTAKQVAVTRQDGAEYKTVSYFSRTFPATLYTTSAPSFEWRPMDVAFDRIAYRDSSGRVQTATSGRPIGRLGAPWLVVWKTASTGDETIPILIRFQHRPTSLRFDGALSATFGGPAGTLAAMPLYGIWRPKNWQSGITPEGAKQADFWSKALAAFPVKTDESFALSHDEQSVTISDRFMYLDTHDDWGTQPLRLAPVSPVTAIAAANGYPARFDQKLEKNALATFLGPFAYCEGSKTSYTLSIPAARDQMLAPTRIVGAADKLPLSKALSDMVAKEPPKAEDYADGGWNLPIKEYSQAFPLLDDATRKATAAPLAVSLRRAFDPSIMLTVTEPATGQRYLMNSKIWCANEAYDREWYAGRQLDAAAEYAAWVDPNAVKPYWKQIAGLYAYFRIYSDWAWSGTSSSIFGYALCGDGMNFAMEGMLGVARMAHQFGDHELYRDASYRAAKQQLCTYASFFMPQWVKDVDYATWTDTSYDYETKKGRYQSQRMAPDKVETRFGLDIFTDTNGIRVLRPGMFWHTVSGFFWDNPAVYRLYAERLYERARAWEYDIMPKENPGWDDHDVIEKYTNQPYGNNHTLTHLDARSVLFGDSNEAIREHMRKLVPDIPFHFRLRLAEDLVAAGTPQVWAPIRQARLIESTWNARTRTLTVKLNPLEDGPLAVDTLWRPRPKASPLRPKTRAKPLLGGFYRVSVEGRKGVSVTVRIAF